MGDLLEKVSSYNIFNYLFPGVIFALLGSEITGFRLILDDLIIGAFAYYFYGVIISRIGSLFVEPALKKTGIIKFADYPDFVAAAHIDSKIDVLSEQNNSYRTIVSLFMCLAALLLADRIRAWSNVTDSRLLAYAILPLFAMFVFAYRKQTTYITNRIAAVLKKDNAND